MVRNQVRVIKNDGSRWSGKFPFRHPPQSTRNWRRGEGSPQVLTSLQGQQEPRKAGDVLPGAQGSDLNIHISPRTPPSQSPRLLRPAPGRVLGFHIWRMGEGRSSCNEPRAKETTCLAVDLCFSSFLNRLKKHNSAPSLPRSFQVIFFAEGGKCPAGTGQVTGGLEPSGHRRPRALEDRGPRPAASTRRRRHVPHPVAPETGGGLCSKPGLCHPDAGAGGEPGLGPPACTPPLGPCRPPPPPPLRGGTARA